MKEIVMEYVVEVQADSTGTWAGNGKKFDTEDEAKDYALDLYRRWSAVKEWRVVLLSIRERQEW
jgi:hypothetical protein